MRAGKHALTFVLVTVLLDMVGVGLIVPVVPSILRELTGRSTEDAATVGGWLFFSYAAMQFLFSPVIGSISDAIGRRPVLILSVLGLGLDYALTGFAPSLGWLFVGRIVAGICGGSYATANAFIADVTAPEERGRAYGLMGAAFGVGFIVGPAIGGQLGSFGPRVPFFVAAGVSLVNAAYGLIVLPESLPKEQRRRFALRRANPIGALWAMRGHRRVQALLFGLFCFLLAGSVYPSVWTFYTMSRYGWTEGWIGLSFAVFGGVGILVQGVLAGPIIQRIGERNTASIALASEIVSYAALGLATEGWMVLALIVLNAMSGLAMPALNALLSKDAPDSAQGALQGSISSLEGLSTIVGPIVMTQLFREFARPDAPVHVPGAPFFFSCALSIAALVVLRSVRAK